MQTLLNMSNMVCNVHILYLFLALFVWMKASSPPITAIQPFGNHLTRLKRGNHCLGIQSVPSQVNPTKQTTPMSTSGSRTQVSMTVPHTIAQYARMRIHMPQPIQKKNGVETKSVKKKIQQTRNTGVVWVNNQKPV